MAESGLGILGFIIFFLMLFLIAIWVLLPFAVFGIQKRLNEANLRLAEITGILRSVNSRLADSGQSGKDVERQQ